MKEYMYDTYDENEFYYDSLDDYHDNVGGNYKAADWTAVYENCVFPSFLQISHYMFPFLMANVILCCGSKIQTRYLSSHHNLTHLLSFVCGSLILYNSIESGLLYFVQLVVSVYFLIKISFMDQKIINFQSLICVFVILYLVICEILEGDPKVWHHIRGVLMIAAMKTISLAFDTRNDRTLRDQFSILSFLGYICCPANCIFGPWTSFHEYLMCFTKAKSRFNFNISYFTHLIINLTLSIICLLVSNCTEAVFNPQYSWKWIIAYCAAFSFRMSHYFVSFLSQATMVSSGFTTNIEHLYKSTPIRHTRFFGYTVVCPWSIEFPRSLVQVVVAWNVPMHSFLKQYIFRALKPRGTFVAVFLTYVTSSLLHGLNFELWATLLTIGIWSYVEYNIRNKLAQIFSACVLVTKCPVPCNKHKLDHKKLLTLSINAIFFVLCIVNLTYLGAIFGANSQTQMERFTLKDTLNKWHNLDYVSHWLLLLGYIFNWLV